MSSKTKTKVALAYCVHDDSAFLAASIRSFQTAGGEMVAFVSRVPWSGEPGDWEGAVRIVEAAGGTAVLGDWPDESEHRRAALEHLRAQGFSHALIPDGDELVEPGLLKALLSVAKEDLADVVRVDMDTYWKSPEYRIRPRERLSPILLLRLDRVEHRHVREYEGARTLRLDASYGVLHHLSYVGTDERIRRKISSWSHRHELVPRWFEQIWLGWEADRTMQNLHPTHPAAYGFAQRIPVPEILDDPELKECAEARRTAAQALPEPWPKVSIVVPTCGLSPIFDRCLAALQAAGDLLHEVIVVADGPCPGLGVPKADLFRTVKIKKRSGFAPACNRGIAEASGQVLVFLNDDAVLTRPALIELIRPLVGAGTVGAVGPLSDRSGHFQQVQVPEDATEHLGLFAEDFAAREAQPEETDMLVGLCLAVPRRVFDEVGVFDERFAVGTFEDNDLCYRLRRAGYRLLIATNSFVHHRGSSSLPKFEPQMEGLLDRNEAIYLAKWKRDLETGYASHLSGLAAPRIAFDPGRRPETLEAGIAAKAKRADISLCMIVKNEERVLRECLESIRPFVAEMIVVDTGSTDRTVEIAQGCGAQVHHFAWTDSFAEARNESLRPAKGKWIFWMDADDTIEWGSGEMLVGSALAAPGDVDGFIVPVQFVDDGEGTATRVDHVKLVRNFEGVGFEHRIHEQVLPSLRRHGGRIVRLEARVMHTGYDTSPEGQAGKSERDWRLLRLEYNELGDHPFVLFNIGMTHHAAGNFAKAARWLRRCIRFCGATDSILRKAYALLGSSLAALGKPGPAVQVLEEGLARVGQDPELHFHLGRTLPEVGRTEDAKRHYALAIGADVSGAFTSFDPDVQGYKALHNLGALCAGTGDYPGAKAHLLKAIELAPRHLRSAETLFDAALAFGDLEMARQMLEHAARQSRRGVLWAEMLSRNAQAVGGPENALEVLRQELGRAPQARPVRLVLARRLIEAGQDDEAAYNFRVLEKSGVAEGAYALGILCARQGRMEEALACFERALELNPGHEETLRQIQSLRRMMGHSDGGEEEVS